MTNWKSHSFNFLSQFPGREAQTVDILLELANRSQKKTEFLGSLQFESSAYPNLNFILNGTFISSLMGGHAELRFDFNNAPDLMVRILIFYIKFNFS